MKLVRSLFALGILVGVVEMPSAAAGGGCHPSPDLKMTTSDAHLVGIGECAFIDTVVYIEPGEQVRWVNKDAVPHTVTGAAYSWGSETSLSRGQDVRYTFDEEGVYPYYCALHPTMVGAVVVGDGAAHAALTNGRASVEEVSALAPPVAADPAEGSTGTSTAAFIGLAIVATLGLATLVARATRSRGTFTDGAPGGIAAGPPR